MPTHIHQDHLHSDHFEVDSQDDTLTVSGTGVARQLESIVNESEKLDATALTNLKAAILNSELQLTASPNGTVVKIIADDTDVNNITLSVEVI